MDESSSHYEAHSSGAMPDVAFPLRNCPVGGCARVARLAPIADGNPTAAVMNLLVRKC